MGNLDCAGHTSAISTIVHPSHIISPCVDICLPGKMEGMHTTETSNHLILKALVAIAWGSAIATDVGVGGLAV